MEAVIPQNDSQKSTTNNDGNNDHLVVSSDPLHPANLICELCRQLYTLGWVTGTGGGISIRSPTHPEHIYIAPSGVQKERLQPTDLFILSYPSKTYLRSPVSLKPSACTPLFLAAYEKRGAGACVHSHGIWGVLVTLLVEGDFARGERVVDGRGLQTFEIERLEQIKGVGRAGSAGNLGYFDRLVVPVIENTAREEDLTESLEAAMEAFPETNAVLVKRHGIYVWGDTWQKAKTQAESLDYIFQVAVEMRKLGIPWT